MIPNLIKQNAPPRRGVLSIRLLSRQELLQFDVLLSVLDVDAAEDGRDFGAEVASVEGEDARVVDNLLLSLHIIDANTAASNIAIVFKMRSAVGDVVASGKRGCAGGGNDKSA